VSTREIFCLLTYLLTSFAKEEPSLFSLIVCFAERAYVSTGTGMKLKIPKNANTFKLGWLPQYAN